MPIIALTVLSLSLMLAGAPAPTPVPTSSRAHAVLSNSTEGSVASPETFDFQQHGPLALLEFLKGTRTPLTFHGIHVGWLRPADISSLLALVPSTQPCGAVMLSISSYIPPDGSTVGHEALYLLDGLRQGRYPPSLHSHPYDEGARAVVVQWAREQLP